MANGGNADIFRRNVEDAVTHGEVRIHRPVDYDTWPVVGVRHDHSVYYVGMFQKSGSWPWSPMRWTARVLQLWRYCWLRPDPQLAPYHVELSESYANRLAAALLSETTVRQPMRRSWPGWPDYNGHAGEFRTVYPEVFTPEHRLAIQLAYAVKDPDRVSVTSRGVDAVGGRVPLRSVADGVELCRRYCPDRQIPAHALAELHQILASRNAR